MFDLSLFRKPAFTGVSIAMLALASGTFANIFFLSLYLQGILGYSPLQAGSRLLFLTMLVFSVPLLARRFVARSDPKMPLTIGLGLAAAGLFLMHGVDPGSGWHQLVPGLLLAGTGIGLANPVIASVAIAVVGDRRAGMASGISNTLRMAGLAFGIATLGALFQAHIAGALGSHRDLAAVVASAGLRAVSGRPGLVPMVRGAFVGGLDDVLMAGAIITALGAVACATLVRGLRREGSPAIPVPAASPRARPPATVVGAVEAQIGRSRG